MKSSSENNPARKRVLLVDDHPAFRKGIGFVLERNSKFDVCGEASNFSEALEAMRTQNPDVAVVDISLPGQDGLELIKALLAERPKLAILVVSMHEESVYALRTLRAGALGYVSKTNYSDDILAALESISDGRLHIGPQFRDDLISRVIESEELDNRSPLDSLSEREKEIVGLIGRGHSTREIAKALGISMKTVETHRNRTKNKLGLRDGGELVRFAIDWAKAQNR